MGRSRRSTPEERVAAECHCLPLRMVNRIVTGLYDDALRALDLRVSQMNVLAAIANMGEDATPTRVSRFLVIEKSTLSRDLVRMEERGWITTEQQGAGRKLALTAAGRRLLDRAIPAWETAQRQTEALLGKTMTQALRTASARARTRLQNPPADGDNGG